MAARSEKTQPMSAPFPLTAASLANLSPHRLHESNWFKNLLCNFGVHRWYYFELDGSIPAKAVSFCRWCPKVKLPGDALG
jgi:hypothetical protein